MAISVEPDQTAPIAVCSGSRSFASILKFPSNVGAVCSGSRSFASILKFPSNVRQLFAADDFKQMTFLDAFFLAL